MQPMQLPADRDPVDLYRRSQEKSPRITRISMAADPVQLRHNLNARGDFSEEGLEAGHVFIGTERDEESESVGER